MWLLWRVPLYLWELSYRLLSLRTNIHSWDYIPIFLISWNLKIWQVSIWGNASKGTLWCVWMLSCFLKGCFLLMLACFLLDFLLSTGWVLWFFFSIGFLVSLVLKFLVDFSYDFSLMCYSFFFFKIFWCEPFYKVSIEFLTILGLFYILFCCFVFGPEVCGILAPPSGTEPISPSLEGDGLPLDHQGNPLQFFLNYWFIVLLYHFPIFWSHACFLFNLVIFTSTTNFKTLLIVTFRVVAPISGVYFGDIIYYFPAFHSFVAGQAFRTVSSILEPIQIFPGRWLWSWGPWPL